MIFIIIINCIYLLIINMLYIINSFTHYYSLEQYSYVSIYPISPLQMLSDVLIKNIKDVRITTIF